MAHHRRTTRFTLNRARVLALLTCAVFTAPLVARCAPQELPEADWELYRQTYISAEGRVVDSVNERVSHSEGQGYGMLLAEAWNDAPTFDLLWNWTRRHLQVRTQDKLLSWRWRPTSPDSTEGKVDDPNNASDGDVLVAWALYRASVRWKRKDYFDAAMPIIAELRMKCLRRNGRAVFILPGANGFEKSGFTVLNLSYWVFPAFQDFAKVDAAADWTDLTHTGMALLRKSRFGDYALPPDWLQVSAQTVKPAEEFEPLFSYNAIRIPLHLWWGNERDKKLYEPYADFLEAFQKKGQVSASLNLYTNEPGPHATLLGMREILDIPTALSRGSTPTASTSLPAGESYYSASLLLLAKVAAREQRVRSTDLLPSSIELGPGLPVGPPPRPLGQGTAPSSSPSARPVPPQPASSTR